MPDFSTHTQFHCQHHSDQIDAIDPAEMTGYRGARLAATVLLVRDGVQGLEVFAQERVSTMRNFPGITVFPGGGVDHRDFPARSWDSGEHWCGPSAVSLARRMETNKYKAHALVFAAVRELFEEAGALLAVLFGLIVGTVLGIIAGVRRGWVDAIIMRIVDVLLSIPGLLLSLSVIIVLGHGIFNAAIAVGITSVATFARLARSQVLSVAGSDFVEAAYGSGGSAFQVLVRHILPNSLTAVFAVAALQFGLAILQLATLGFLGYGAPPPTPEWGLLISESRDYIATAGWLTIAPGIVIVAVVLAANYLSQTLRKAA